MSGWEALGWTWLAGGALAVVVFTAYRAWECRSGGLRWEWPAYAGRVLLLLLFWPLAALAVLALIPGWVRQRRDRR